MICFFEKLFISKICIILISFCCFIINNFVYCVVLDDRLKIVSYSDAIGKAIPYVVSIQTVQEVPLSVHPLFNDPMFKFFFGDQEQYDLDNPKNNRHLQQGLGSGIIMDDRGYILTNHHVIRDAKSITVKLYDGTIADVEIIGSDTKTDLSVLRITNEKHMVPGINHVGVSTALEVGDIVLAIGNPFGFDHTVTQGIVSAMGSISARSSDSELPFVGLLDNLIQTDAAINPGNSGGALIDIYGNLIGINMAIISRSGGSQGIGFAVPIDMAKEVMEELVAKGGIIRGWLGVYLVDLNQDIRDEFVFYDRHGVYVQATIRNSPAQKAGILPGDILVSIDDNPVYDGSEAIRLISTLEIGKSYIIELYRNNTFLSHYVFITQSPE